MTSSGGSDPAPPDRTVPTFRVLGPVSVWDGRTYQPLTASRPVSMLAALLTSPNEITSNDFLRRAVWGDDTDVEPRAALRTCTTRLRKLLLRHGLGEELIQTVSGGYRLQASAADLDLLLFRERVAAATRLGDRPSEVAALRGALAIWQGALLCNVGSEVLHRGVVPLLEEERLQVLERIVGLLVRDGDDQAALTELRSLTRSHQGHEGFALQLVEVLHRTGRREEALAECVRIKAYLADELGLDPTPELVDAERTILAGSRCAVAPTARTERAGTVPSEKVPSAAPRTSRTLAGSPEFVGREEALRRLSRCLATDADARPICVLVGPPGVGKTGLALRAAHRVAVDGQGSGLDPAVAGQALIRVRDARGHRRPPAELTSDVARVAATGPRLVVVDDAAEEDVAAIADRLPGSALLVTTTQPALGLVRTHGAVIHRVAALSMAEALTLLNRLLGEGVVAEDMLAAYEIAATCWRHPLALRILAARLQTRPAWSLGTAATWLADDPVQRLSEGSTDGGLAAYFGGALDRLDPALADAVLRLARLAEEPFGWTEIRGALPRRPDARTLVHDLVEIGWLEEPAPSAFRFDPFVRACAQAAVVCPARPDPTAVAATPATPAPQEGPR